MAGNPRRANGHRRDQIREKWRAIGDPCHICGEPIDYSLGWIEAEEPDPATGELVTKRRMHPRAFVVDEIVPVAKGGDPLDFGNTQPAHWECNAAKGDGSRAPRAPMPDAGDFPQPWAL